VKNRFQSLPFKCNLQRYIVVKGQAADNSAQPQFKPHDIKEVGAVRV
jgi:hypothetical protein